jgi:hypothetical protein
MSSGPDTPLRIRFGRALAHYLVPPGIRETERRVRKALACRKLVRKHRELLLPNEELRGRHAGRRCFVIANGPSLARQDLAPLAGELTIVANGFWNHPIVERWNPTYYCLVDPVFFDGTPAMARFFEELRTRCPRSTLIVPLAGKDLVGDGHAAGSSVRFVAPNGYLVEQLCGMPDLTRVIPNMFSVSALQLMVAMYLGCSPIYLMGFDHDWLATRGDLGHFFQGPTVKDHATAAPGAGFARNYRTLMEGQLSLWKRYEQLGAIAERAGLRILNATDGGYLDVFPRAAYGEVIGAR